jgi:hypothetical protein
MDPQVLPTPPPDQAGPALSRRTVLRSIGPVWDGNEVWLLAGGGTLYFAFPALYASSFSGFYLPQPLELVDRRGRRPAPGHHRRHRVARGDL